MVIKKKAIILDSDEEVTDLPEVEDLDEQVHKI